MKRLLLSWILLVLYCTCAGMATASSNATHRVVAAIAYNELPAETKQALLALLKNHPEFPTWQINYRPDTGSSERGEFDFGLYAFMRASEWPDNNRFNNKVFSHPNWHVMDYPLDPTHGMPLEAALFPQDNLLYGIAYSTQVLTDLHSSDEDKAIYLSWLIHLIGEVHQPVHCACLLKNGDPASVNDQGRGYIYIRTDNRPETAPMYLHMYWDGLLDAFYEPPAAMKEALQLTRRYTPDLLPDLTKDKTPKEWSLESRMVAIQYVYPQLDKQGSLNKAEAPVLSQQYQRDARAQMDQRTALAGYRLAGLLQQVVMGKPLLFPQPQPPQVSSVPEGFRVAQVPNYIGGPGMLFTSSPQGKGHEIRNLVTDYALKVNSSLPRTPFTFRQTLSLTDLLRFLSSDNSLSSPSSDRQIPITVTLQGSIMLQTLTSEVLARVFRDNKVVPQWEAGVETYVVSESVSATRISILFSRSDDAKRVEGAWRDLLKKRPDLKSRTDTHWRTQSKQVVRSLKGSGSIAFKVTQVRRIKPGENGTADEVALTAVNSNKAAKINSILTAFRLPKPWTVYKAVPDPLVFGKASPKSLGMAFDHIMHEIATAKFPAPDVYSFNDDGFAVVTQPEFIKPEGDRLPGEYVWTGHLPDFLSWEYQDVWEGVNRWASQYTGSLELNCRVLVILVTGQKIDALKEKSLTLDRLCQGPAPYNRSYLSQTLKPQKVSDAATAYVFIYHFKQRRVPPPVLLEQAVPSAQDHVHKAGMWLDWRD